MEMIQEYIVPITASICFCVGFIVKKWVADVDNKWIPTICSVLGVAVNIWLMGAFSPAVVLGGLASGLAATGFDQLIRTGQSDEKEK